MFVELNIDKSIKKDQIKHKCEAIYKISQIVFIQQ